MILYIYLIAAAQPSKLPPVEKVSQAPLLSPSGFHSTVVVVVVNDMLFVFNSKKPFLPYGATAVLQSGFALSRCDFSAYLHASHRESFHPIVNHSIAVNRFIPL